MNQQRLSCLVLGATGTVGFALCLRLVKEGRDVHGAPRFSAPERRFRLEQNGVRCIPFDSEQGGRDTSVWGDATKMIKMFGRPRQSIEVQTETICRSL